MNTLEKVQYHLPEIENRLNYSFNDKALLLLAFIHCSFINENRQIKEHNERLEFLGDSVLGLIVSNYLYHLFPNTPEGDLSTYRSRLVDAVACNQYIQTLHLEGYLLLGRGERMNSGRGRESILADLFEAIIGAIFLDRGLEAAQTFFFHHFSSQIQAIIETPLNNWKSLLQDRCQKQFQQTPVYTVIQEGGPDHNKIFEVAVFINNSSIGVGTGSSKKEAQQMAAQKALKHLEETDGH